VLVLGLDSLARRGSIATRIAWPVAQHAGGTVSPRSAAADDSVLQKGPA